MLKLNEEADVCTGGAAGRWLGLEDRTSPGRHRHLVQERQPNGTKQYDGNR